MWYFYLYFHFVVSQYYIYISVINFRLPMHITPEIQRTPLHEVVLTIKLLNLGDVESFLVKALEPPPQVQSAKFKVHKNSRQHFK